MQVRILSGLFWQATDGRLTIHVASLLSHTCLPFKFKVKMTTTRKFNEYYTEVKRIVDGKVKQTQCSCKGPGMTPKECATISGNKYPCRCDCHKKRDPVAQLDE